MVASPKIPCPTSPQEKVGLGWHHLLTPLSRRKCLPPSPSWKTPMIALSNCNNKNPAAKRSGLKTHLPCFSGTNMTSRWRLDHSSPMTALTSKAAASHHHRHLGLPTRPSSSWQPTHWPPLTQLCPMNICQPALLQNLRIWHQNVHKSKTVQSYILNTANPKDWDIIALQEPGSIASATCEALNIGEWFTQQTSTWKDEHVYGPFSQYAQWQHSGSL